MVISEVAVLRLEHNRLLGEFSDNWQNQKPIEAECIFYEKEKSYSDTLSLY